jgi:hypothetical protein
MSNEFNELTDVDINVLVDYLSPIYNEIRIKIAGQFCTNLNHSIETEAMKQLGEKENFEIIRIDDEGPFWLVRFPSEQHKLQYLLKHL